MTEDKIGWEGFYFFTSAEAFEIAGRGTSHITMAPHDYKRDECPFLDRIVLLNGRLVHVIGVESHAVCPTRKGAEIALLVKEEEQ